MGQLFIQKKMLFSPINPESSVGREERPGSESLAPEAAEPLMRDE
jgi:hypothetical protein